MTLINELTEFKPGEKAKAAEVNQNFETLRLSNNDQENKITNLQSEIQTKMDAEGGTLAGALKLNKYSKLSSSFFESFLSDRMSTIKAAPYLTNSMLPSSTYIFSKKVL